MQSTARSAGCRAASSAARRARTSFLTEEAVSVCTASTARIAWLSSPRRRFSTRSGSMPARKAEVHHLDVDAHGARHLRPAEAEAAGGDDERLLAGARMLAMAASQAAWPLPM